MHEIYAIPIAILGLALLMVVHECGHFFVARAFGMRVTRFSIGFGPTFFKIVPRDGYFWFTTAADRIRLRMWRHDPERHGPTIYQVAMIPFLAYVQIAGMNPLEDIDQDDKGSYANSSLIGRILTIFGGPFANYLFASVLFFVSFLAGGHMVPDLEEPGSTEVTVMANWPADQAGLKNGDRIVEINQKPVERWTEIRDIISHHPGETLPIVVERSGQRVAISVTPRRAEPTPGKSKPGRGQIGIQPRMHHEDVSAREAAVLAISAPPKVVKNTIISLGQVFSGEAEGELSGPVGMVRETAREVRAGLLNALSFLASLSAYLGAFNLVPFPALDGGRLMFLGYEATTRRRPNARTEAHIHFVGLVMMLGLMLYVTVFNDFRHRSESDAPPGPLPAGSTSPAPKQPEPAQPAPAATGAAPSGK